MIDGEDDLVCEDDLLSQVLGVPDGGHDEDEDEEGPPKDGLEYLRRVMKEAKKCPQVVTVGKEKRKGE